MSRAGGHQVDGGLCVQYGCGLVAPSGWLSFDASPSLWLQRLPVVGGLVASVLPITRYPKQAAYGDVTRRLPVRDESAACVYCSHLLEHLTRFDCRKALAETFRILRPGGIFRMVLPDLALLVKRFNESEDIGRAHVFMRDSLLGTESRPRGLRRVLPAMFTHGDHQWMWEQRSLTKELHDSGFENIRRATIGDSGIAAFEPVEDERRWTDSLGMQCNKPLDGEARASSEKRN